MSLVQLKLPSSFTHSFERSFVETVVKFLLVVENSLIASFKIVCWKNSRKLFCEKIDVKYLVKKLDNILPKLVL